MTTPTFAPNRIWLALWAIVLMPLTLTSSRAETAGEAPTHCASYGYIIAFQGIDGSKSPFAPEWITPIKDSGGTILVDEAPSWVYEGPKHWGRVLVARWRCFEEAEAVWKSLPPPPEQAGNAPLRTAALYRGSTYLPPPQASRDLPKNCNSPVYLMAMNTTINQTQYDVYRDAMRKTDYVLRLGSEGVFFGGPVSTLDTWPANVAASMTRWPCKAAFERFIFDKTYVEKIKPLRAGAIIYRILGFKNAVSERY